MIRDVIFFKDLTAQLETLINDRGRWDLFTVFYN